MLLEARIKVIVAGKQSTRLHTLWMNDQLTERIINLVSGPRRAWLGTISIARIDSNCTISTLLLGAV